MLACNRTQRPLFFKTFNLFQINQYEKYFFYENENKENNSISHDFHNLLSSVICCLYFFRMQDF